MTGALTNVTFSPKCIHWTTNSSEYQNKNTHEKKEKKEKKHTHTKKTRKL